MSSRLNNLLNSNTNYDFIQFSVMNPHIFSYLSINDKYHLFNNIIIKYREGVPNSRIYLYIDNPMVRDLFKDYLVKNGRL